MFLHQSAHGQRSDHAIGIDPSDGSDLGASHRLLVRNDGERLERRLRQARSLPVGNERSDNRLKLAAADILPSASAATQGETSRGDTVFEIPIVFTLKRFERVADILGIAMQRARQVPFLLRPIRDHQHRFQTRRQAAGKIIHLPCLL